MENFIFFVMIFFIIFGNQEIKLVKLLDSNFFLNWKNEINFLIFF